MNLLTQRENASLVSYDVSQKNNTFTYEVSNETNFKYHISPRSEVFLNGVRLGALEKRDKCSVCISQLKIPHLLFSINCQWPTGSKFSYFKPVWRKYRKNRSFQASIFPAEIDVFRSLPVPHHKIKNNLNNLLASTAENKLYVNVLSKFISPYADLFSHFTLSEFKDRGMNFRLFNFTSESMSLDDKSLTIEFQGKKTSIYFALKQSVFVTCYHVDKCSDVICIDIAYTNMNLQRRIFVHINHLEKSKFYSIILKPTLRWENFNTYKVIDGLSEFCVQDAYEPFYALTASRNSLKKIMLEEKFKHVTESFKKLNFSIDCINSYQVVSVVNDRAYTCTIDLVNNTSYKISADIEGYIRVNGLPIFNLKNSCVVAAYHPCNNVSIIKFKKYQSGKTYSFKYCLGFQNIDQIEYKSFFENFKRAQVIKLMCAARSDLYSEFHTYKIPYDVFKIILYSYLRLEL